MRIFYILVLTYLLVSCLSLKQNNIEISNHIADLKRIISKPIFNKSSKTIIHEIELCKVGFSSQWSSTVSKRKGFHSVKTTVVIDFINNYENSLFISAHYETGDGITIQIWGDLIEINLFEEVEVKKVTLIDSNSDKNITNYNTDYVSIGVSDPSNIEKISELLDVLSLISTSCKSL